MWKIPLPAGDAQSTAQACCRHGCAGSVPAACLQHACSMPAGHGEAKDWIKIPAAVSEG